MSTEYILCCLIGYLVNFFLSQLSAKRVNNKDDKDDIYINNNKGDKGKHGSSDVDSGVGVV